MIEQLQRKLDSYIGARNSIQSEIERKQSIQSSLKKRKRNIEEAQIIIQKVAKDTQEELSENISKIVTLALNSIFDARYEFGISYDPKRGKTEARLFFKKGENEVSPMDDSGGGVVDVASFALRIGLWYLSRPRPSNTMILDEPFKFLSRDLQNRATEMLKLLSNKLGIQFIIVSHDLAIIEGADKTFEVIIKKGVSEVKEKTID
jgi:DNA repair exonuclease SbcCD ATPase subunit